MAIDESESSRVEELIAKFEGLLKKRRSHDAAKLLREASAIDPNDKRVSAGWDALKLLEDEPGPALFETCREYIEFKEEELGQRAVQDAAQAGISEADAGEVLQLLFNEQEVLPLFDSIAGNLLAYDEAQKALAKLFVEEATKTFRGAWQLGENTMKGVLRTLLHTFAWSDDQDRIQAGKNVLLLLLAWLLRSGEAHELAMKSIAQLLAAEAPNLESCIDSGNFDIILNNLEITNAAPLRSQATLATAKFLEAAPERGRKLLTEFVVMRVANGKTQDLIVALSAAGAVFPVVPSVAVPLLLTEGFLDDLLALLERSKSRTLRKAGLQLLSTACIDKDCREAIAKKYYSWLQSIVDENSDPADAALAALVLSKLGVAAGDSSQKQSNGKKAETPVTPIPPDEELVPKLKGLVTGSGEDAAQSAIEGLAYRSQQSKIKEDLAKDRDFLDNLIKALLAAPSTGPVIFGGLTIFDNLTKYPLTLSEEQKKMAQLQAYANQTKPAPPDPLENDERATRRCKRVLDAGVASVLMKHFSKCSPTVRGIVASIILSISKHPKHRGEMVQKGLLAPCIAFASLPDDPGIRNVSETRHASAFALARLLVPIDPSLIFKSRTANAPSVAPTVRALVPLLSPNDSQTDLMPVFEALRALTNIASLPDDNAAQNTILTSAFPQVDSLLWSNNTRIQQAAMELICNLCPSPQMSDVLLSTTNKIPSLSSSPQQRTARLKLILALTRHDNLGTRLAAMATVASIAAFEFGTERLLKHNKSVEWTLESLEDDEMGMKQRSLATMSAMLYPDPASAEIVEMVVERGRIADGVRIIKNLKGVKQLDATELEVCLSALEGNQGVR